MEKDMGRTLKLSCCVCVKTGVPSVLGLVKLLQVSLPKWGDKPATPQWLATMVSTIVVSGKGSTTRTCIACLSLPICETAQVLVG